MDVDTGIWVSTRRTFREGDAGWPKYIEFVGLPALTEVRSLDSMLNEYVDDCGECSLQSFDELESSLASLPRPSNDREYHLLFMDAEHEEPPPTSTQCTLLGFDLSDWTHTSSLLNCGPWIGELARFTSRLNRYGLLSYDDALSAKAILPLAWPDHPHADVTVWALYEIVPAR